MSKIEVVSPTHKKFGDRIKELREKHKLTQEDLADMVEVDRSYMGFVERGQKNPTLDKLRLIAKAFHISLSELFKGV